MTDPQEGIDRDLESDDPITEEAPEAADPAPPADLNATVTLSPEALAALLEEVKKGKR